MKRCFKVFSLMILTVLIVFNFVYQEKLFVNAEDVSMILEFDTTKSAGKKVVLPIGTAIGNTNCFIDWGDETVIENITEPGLVNHEYIEEGIYQVEITGTYDSFGYKDSIPEDLDACSKLIRVVSFSNLDNLNLSGAFYGAVNLIEVPNVLPSGIKNISKMFYNCSSFNQDLSEWDFSNLTNSESFSDAFYNTSMSVDNYDALLNNLNETLTLPSNVSFDMGLNVKYSLRGKVSRNALVSKSWEIVDGGVVSINVSVNDATKVYGENDPSYIIEYGGFITGHGEDEITGDVSFEREEGEDVGSYIVSASGLISTFYEINYQTGILSITKADYDMSEVVWEYEEAFVYDGLEKEIKVINLPIGVSVNSYTNNKKTEAGSYIANVSLNYDTTNYNKPIVGNLIWTIFKADYDISEVVWEYEEAFIYDGTLKSVALINLPNGVSVDSYLENEKISPGEYTASAILNYDAVNYNAPLINNLKWKILAPQTAPTNVRGVLQTSNFHSNAKIINVNNLMEFKEENASEWISIETEEVTGLSSGVYLVRFKAKDGFIASPSVEINLVKLFFSLDNEDDIIITNVDGGVILTVSIIEEKEVLFKDIEKEVKTNFKNKRLKSLYEISLTKEDELYNPENDANVKILIPLELKDNEEIMLIHYQDGEALEIDFIREEDYIEFFASSFGYYGIAIPKDKVNWLIIISIVVLLTMSVISTVFGYKYYTKSFRKNLNLKN